MTLEQLLNKLIEKGRVPFGLEGVKAVKYAEQYYRNYNWDFWGGGWQQWRSLRQIVSKESGLWQFVCENRMTKKMEKVPRGIWINSWSKSAYEKYPVYTMEKAEYRLIESALFNEEDLEQFLLDNIKVDGE